MYAGFDLRVLVLVALVACGRGREAARRAEVTTALKTHLLGQVDEWLAASRALRDAAPTPTDRGWDRQGDAAAIDAMKQAWSRGRRAYELIEGAIAPLFPESDTATDARYEDLLLLVGPSGDPKPFDGQGIVGMHAIERVLWADEVDPLVLDYEKNLPGYGVAAMPASAAQAAEFRTGLATRLAADVESLRADLAPLEPDLAFAYRGLIDLVREQIEKVDKTSSGEEESRYARATLRDLRANLEGSRQVYAMFRPWLRDSADGAAIDARVTVGFEKLQALYSASPGDAMPRPPSTWSAVDPRPSDLETPFGVLFTGVKRECNDRIPGALLAELRQAGKQLRLPEVP